MAKKPQLRKRVSKASSERAKKAKAPALSNAASDKALKAAKAREEKHLKAVGLYEKALGFLQRRNFDRAGNQAVIFSILYRYRYIYQEIFTKNTVFCVFKD